MALNIASAASGALLRAGGSAPWSVMTRSATASPGTSMEVTYSGSACDADNERDCLAFAWRLTSSRSP
jgi:hypothetical protein